MSQIKCVAKAYVHAYKMIVADYRKRV